MVGKHCRRDGPDDDGEPRLDNRQAGRRPAEADHHAIQDECSSGRPDESSASRSTRKTCLVKVLWTPQVVAAVLGLVRSGLEVLGGHR